MTPKNPGPCPKCGFFNCSGGEQCPAWEDKVKWDPDDTIKAPTNVVQHPAHYTTGKIEVIDFILDQKLGYCLGNAIKYICRCNHKGNRRQDLEKAIQYLKFEIEKGGA